MNLLSEDLEDLELGDTYYDFSVHGDTINIDIDDNKEECDTKMVDLISTVATNIAQNHLDRVMLGLDDD